MLELTRIRKWLVIILITGCSSGAVADSQGVSLPQLPAAKGEQCVEPTDVMRRNHYEFILHQRDETMHKGIRSSKYSLTDCIDCHVLPDENKHYLTHQDSEHFCVSCHEYAAVKIDCFQCHSSKPVTPADTSKDTGASSNRALLKSKLAQMHNLPLQLNK